MWRLLIFGMLTSKNIKCDVENNIGFGTQNNKIDFIYLKEKKKAKLTDFR
jgi:hypothetical protein